MRLFNEVQARTDELARSVEELQGAGRGQPRRQLDARPRDSALDDRRQGGAALRDGCRRDLRLQQAAPEIPAARHLRHERGADCRHRASRRIGLGESYIGAAAQRREPLQVPDLVDEPPQRSRDIVLQRGLPRAAWSFRSCGRIASSALSWCAARSRACSRNRRSTSPDFRRAIRGRDPERAPVRGCRSPYTGTGEIARGAQSRPGAT